MDIRFPAPPVNHTMWDGYSWVKYTQMNGVNYEPNTINSTFGVWIKTDKVDEKGNALYKLRDNNDTLRKNKEKK